VFINGDHVLAFAASLSRIMVKKHAFIVHNSDRSFDSTALAALLPFALSIWAINTNVTHPLLRTIPLGFPDQAVPFTMTYTRPNIERDIEIYANFTVGTNTTKRNDCLAAFAVKKSAIFCLRSKLALLPHRLDTTIPKGKGQPPRPHFPFITTAH
jgi:hypothetical protein